MQPALQVDLPETEHGYNVLLVFRVFQKHSFHTSTLCGFQECLYPKVKTEGCAFHSKNCLCVGRDQSVNQQNAHTAITTMVIKSQGLHQVKNRQRETSRRAEPIFVSAFAVWRWAAFWANLAYHPVGTQSSFVSLSHTEMCGPAAITVGLYHRYLFIFWKRCSWWWLYWF